MPAEARDLLACQPVERKVAGDLTVTLRHPRLGARAVYRVAQVPGVRVSGRVEVQALMMSEAGDVLVRTTVDGEVCEQRVSPVEHDEVGLPLDAPTWGEYEPTEPTEAEREQERIAALAGDPKPGEASLGGTVRALDAIGDGAGNVVPFPRRGVPAAEPAEPAPEVLPVVAAARYCARAARRRRGAAEYFGEVRRRWPAGATTAELDAWASGLTTTHEEETG